MDGPPDAPRPDYGGACLSELVPTITSRRALAESDALPSWFPAELVGAGQVVLLVLDGLGAEQLAERAKLAPTLCSLTTSVITSVAPTTTASALTSITTGRPPSEHGLLGYRLLVGGEVLNVLRWTTPSGDARRRIPPEQLQSCAVFADTAAAVVSRAEFDATGFTRAHLKATPRHGWRMPSSIALEVAAALGSGAPLVFAYYDGIDKIAHEHGLGEHYAAELRATDVLVADLIEALPAGTGLLVTADHGQVEVTTPPIVLDDEISELTEVLSGEGRFRWLHARPGARRALVEASRERYAAIAWVMTRDELVDGGYFGGPLPAAHAARLGDVALIAREPVAFSDPADKGELRLVARHGSLTAAELEVPLLAGCR